MILRETNCLLMDSGTAHLLEASIKLKCSLEVTSKGLLLYHLFMRCASEIQTNKDLIAAGALSLSGRLYEQLIDVDALICVFYSIIHQTHDVMSSDDVAYDLIKTTLSRIDYMMIRLLEFDLTHRTALQYLMPFLTMIFERSKHLAYVRAELGRTCIRFICDFYTQPISLEFTPELIAIASIDLSLHIHGLLSDLAMIPEWYMGFTCDATPDRVKLLKKIMLNVYEKFFTLTPAQLEEIQAQGIIARQLRTSQPHQDASTKVQKVPSQGHQIEVTQSHVQQVVQSPAQLVAAPPQVKQVLPTEVLEVEDMDISL